MVENHRKFFHFLKKFRENSLASLPDQEHVASRIQMDLLIILACNNAENKKVTVKNLLSNSAFSGSGGRRYFEFLLSAGYVSLEADQGDRRVRHVKVSKLLEETFDKWATQGIGLLDDYYQDH